MSDSAEQSTLSCHRVGCGKNMTHDLIWFFSATDKDAGGLYMNTDKHVYSIITYQQLREMGPSFSVRWSWRFSYILTEVVFVRIIYLILTDFTGSILSKIEMKWVWVWSNGILYNLEFYITWNYLFLKFYRPNF